MRLTLLVVADVGGLDDIISSLRESVIFPLLYPKLFTTSSSLLTAPKGVLLYGPPGCGKTMLAKALARESGAAFLNLSVSSLVSKWYGESNQLVSAVFGLARGRMEEGGAEVWRVPCRDEALRVRR